jgi:hypothetical protein
MFEQCLNDQDYLNNLETNAMKYIENDRKQLSVIYETIETFIKDNSFIISQPELLYESKFNLAELTTITIFCENIFRHSNKLINLLANALDIYEKSLSDDEKNNPLTINISARWLILKTVVAHEEINIFFDGRLLVVFKAINRYKNIDIFKMLLPVKSKIVFFTSSELLLLPPELELMDIYHKLYSPDKADNWEDLIKTEYHLYENLLIRTKTIIGGAKDCVRNIITNIETIKKLIVLDFIKDQPAVLIGDWAIKLMEYGETGKAFQDNFEKVQLIIDCPIEEFNELLENFLKTISPYKPTFREEKLHIISDSRLKKYTFYISGVCSISGQRFERPFLDVFNSGSYELIPYRISKEFMTKKGGFNNDHKKDSYPDDIKIGSAYVLLRFLLLDIWILRIIKNLGLITPSILETKIMKLFETMAIIKNERKLNKLITKSFQHDNYIGNYQSLIIYQKNKLQDAKFPPYTPYYWKLSHGSYRDI